MESKDAWDKNLNRNVPKEYGTLQKKKRRSARGNKNAEGHGGTGPPEIRITIKTGEFEALFFDCLDPEEKRLTEMNAGQGAVAPAGNSAIDCAGTADVEKLRC